MTVDMDWWMMMLYIKILQTSVCVAIVWLQTFSALALPNTILFIVLTFGCQDWTLDAEQRETADTIQPNWKQSIKRLGPKKTVSQPLWLFTVMEHWLLLPGFLMCSILQELSFFRVGSGEDFPSEEMKVWLFASFALIAHFLPWRARAATAHSPMHSTSLSLLFSISLSLPLPLPPEISLSCLFTW